MPTMKAPPMEPPIMPPMKPPFVSAKNKQTSRAANLVCKQMYVLTSFSRYKMIRAVPGHHTVVWPALQIT